MQVVDFHDIFTYFPVVADISHAFFGTFGASSASRVIPMSLTTMAKLELLLAGWRD
jgi:hypothetical protein